jgi:phosphoglycerol transferase MdoB-like AlkP superfamily enzyme
MQFKQRQVMPFLHDLSARSLLVPVNMRRKVGSANSDYEIFSANPAVLPVIYYKYLEEEAFRDFLINKIKRRGYHTTVVYNAPPDSFYAGKAYAAMGFDQAFYEKDMLEAFPDTKPGAGYPLIHDQKLFAYAAAKLAAARQQERQQFMFIVTMSMHPPFNSLEAGHFGRASAYEKYASAAFFVDEGLRRFYQTLPDGAMLIIWGDHISDEEYIQNLPGSHSVPFIIHIKGQTLNAPWNREPLASLYPLGIYLRRWFE